MSIETRVKTLNTDTNITVIRAPGWQMGLSQVVGVMQDKKESTSRGVGIRSSRGVSVRDGSEEARRERSCQQGLDDERFHIGQSQDEFEEELVEVRLRFLTQHTLNSSRGVAWKGRTSIGRKQT